MSIVRQLDIHLTHRCNLRCAYCYAGERSTALPDDLSDQAADSAVDFLLRNSGKEPRISIVLWGGEPFLRPDLIERIARRARSAADGLGKGLSLRVPTNATLLDSTALALVRRLRIDLSLSLDGAPGIACDRRTLGGGEYWDLVGPNLERLLRLWDGPLPAVRMTVVPPRAHRLATDVNFFLEMGFRTIAFLPASGLRWNPEATEQLDTQLQEIGANLVDWLRQEKPNPQSIHT